MADAAEFSTAHGLVALRDDPAPAQPSQCALCLCDVELEGEVKFSCGHFACGGCVATLVMVTGEGAYDAARAGPLPRVGNDMRALTAKWPPSCMRATNGERSCKGRIHGSLAGSLLGADGGRATGGIAATMAAMPVAAAAELAAKLRLPPRGTPFVRCRACTRLLLCAPGAVSVTCGGCGTRTCSGRGVCCGRPHEPLPCHLSASWERDLCAWRAAGLDRAAEIAAHLIEQRTDNARAAIAEPTAAAARAAATARVFTEAQLRAVRYALSHHALLSRLAIPRVLAGFGRFRRGCGGFRHPGADLGHFSASCCARPSFV